VAAVRSRDEIDEVGDIVFRAVAALPIAEAYLGLPWNWRIGSASRPPSDTTMVSRTFAPEGAGLRPFSVAHVEQPWRRARVPGNLVIRWARHTSRTNS